MLPTKPSLSHPSSPKRELLTPDSFATVSAIGRGSYAKVLLVRKRSDSLLYALKIIKKRNVEKRRQESHIETERNALILMAGSPFFVRVHATFQTDTRLYFLLDYCPGGELFALLQRRKRLSEPEARFISAQLLLAIEQLHQKRILYRDLKPENVLIDAEGYIKLTDFGLSRLNHETDDAKSICGTPEYLAPEVLLKAGYGRPYDWWTFGALLFELLTGLPPFFVSNREELFERIRHGQPTYPGYLGREAKHLLQRLLEKQPEKRLGTKGAAEIRQHPWFSPVDWRQLLERKVASPFKPQVGKDFGVRNFDEEFTSMPVDSIEADFEQDLPKHFNDFTWDDDEIVDKRLPRPENTFN